MVLVQEWDDDQSRDPSWTLIERSEARKNQDLGRIHLKDRKNGTWEA